MAREPTKTRVNFYVDDNVLEATKRIAKHRGVAYSEVIRIALREWLVQQIRRKNDE